VENPHSVLTTGLHTQKVVIPHAKATGGLAGFVVVREQCLGCRAPLPKGMKALCPHCRDNSVDHYARHLETVRQKEMEVSRLWTQCQQCQGNVHLEVICVANDCPIFYKRVKARKELAESQKTLQQFDW
jgi:DNA polymerase delta subunit 1